MDGSQCLVRQLARRSVIAQNGRPLPCRRISTTIYASGTRRGPGIAGIATAYARNAGTNCLCGAYAVYVHAGGKLLRLSRSSFPVALLSRILPESWAYANSGERFMPNSGYGSPRAETVNS